MKVFRTLYARLAAVLAGLLALVAVASVATTLWATRRYLTDAHYRLHRDLARRFVSDGLIGAGGAVGEDRLREIFHTLMQVNPSIEVYLTDPRGRLLAYSAPPGRVRLEAIDLGPVRRFLAGTGEGPVWGDNPRAPGQRALFSAAEVRADGELRGYLYVVLAGEPYRGALELFRGSYVARLVLLNTAGLLVAVFALGLLGFFWVTRPVRDLRRRVEAFQREAGETVDPREDGDELRALAAAFDRMRERIADQMARIRRADEERRALIEGISHDLRTPLASLLAHLETAARKGVREGAEGSGHLAEALAAGRRLARLVDELMALARLDAPDAAPCPETFPLEELVQDAVQSFAGVARSRGVEVRVEPPEEPLFVRADLGLVERAVENLLHNAARHSPSGGRVTVRFRRVRPGWVETSVCDEGPGVPPEDLPHVFERRFRGRPEAGDGHGLGLAIVRRVAALHGGTVSARNRPEGGAEFSFTLPEPPPSPGA